MFNSLHGTITHKGTNLLFLATGGVEWELHTTGTSLASLPPEGGEARVLVYLLHREDQMKLFGFASQEERSLFLELIKTDGVGPKVAQKILSAVSHRDLAAAIQREDTAVLESLPGFGKKTAGKVIIQLKGKLPEHGDHGDTEGALTDDLTAALAGMGFDKKQAREAVLKALAGSGSDPADPQAREQAVFKRALSYLSKEGSRR